MEKNGCSFPALVEGYLCSQHRAGALSATPQQVISTIQQCCARGTDFLSPRLPVLEVVFRLLLARGNRPTPAEELAQQMSQLRGEPLYPETVERLLRSEPRFYGVRSQGEEGVSPAL